MNFAERFTNVDVVIVGAGPTRDLAGIRRGGYAITRGAADCQLVGISVPVCCPEAAINASISLIVRETNSNESVDRCLLMTIMPAADMLLRKLRL